MAEIGEGESILPRRDFLFIGRTYISHCPLYEKELNDLIFRRIGNDSIRLIIISLVLVLQKWPDRVLVLDHGTIAEQGKHEELLANSDSLYQKLWNAQLSWYGE